MRLFSCEVEYIATKAVTGQGIWPARLISELKGEYVRAEKLMVDNKSSIAFATILFFIVCLST